MADPTYLEHHPTNLDHGCLFSCYPKPLQDASQVVQAGRITL